MKNSMKLAVLGAGCWGLTIAKLLTDNFENISIWGRTQDLSEELIKYRRMIKPLNIQLDSRIEITDNLAQTVSGAEIILLVTASAGVRPVCRQLKQIGLKESQILVNLAKGLELPSLKRMSEVIKEELPLVKTAVLSGPTLAKEILEGCPTAACISSHDAETAEFLQKHLSVPVKFRLYTNPDTAGVELGGSLKNVIAAASGFACAMKLGDNCRGTLLTRGMAEIVRIGAALGANPMTFYGLSGMGDLIATCSSPSSRNFTAGYMLGQGKKTNDIIKELGSVAEGICTAKAVCALAEKLNVEMPVSKAVYDAFYTDITPEEILNRLMNRKLKNE